ncbi:glycerophosphocholine phosphodiesterase GPCPD1 [Musca vetustissima]|uniref:glycerophosphocholine phosphodiesterase GPCPD1 n=1 Tax=Musca vetustissima TaxID=27455 RepID=UPI002AB7039A|nr:glycerophosphocholine phosphodiesterase GPCPD1 [Musca vetustissima]
MIKHFEVELHEALRPGEGLGITGDHVKLGHWNVDRSLEMKQRRRNPLRWFLKIPMCSALRIYYRFFIYYKDSRGLKRIRRWEGQQHARVLEAYEMYRNQGSLKFGEAHPTAIGGGVQNEKGWLRGELIVQIKFIWPQHIRFTSFSHFIRNLKYNIKLESFPLDESRSELNSDVEIEVARFVFKKSNLRAQSGLGEFYKPGQTMIYHITVPLGFENYYVLNIKSREGEHLGEVTILGSYFQSGEGILELPIIEKWQKQRIGWLTLPYVRIEPLPIAAELNFRSSFHHYWPPNWPTLDVAHRGVGKSFYYHSARALENTIQSFLRAYRLHSDMVELDIQLTKDYVPIVYSDCGFYTANQRNKASNFDMHFVYINRMTYEELRQRRVFVFLNGAMVELSHLNSDFVDEREMLFPRLVDVFKYLPLSVGLIMEVKWPQLLSSGSLEYLQSLDKNKYVDTILMASMQNSCGRPLIFTSFDADICSMIRFKQHVFPVVLLTVGQRSPWEPYADLRTRSLTSAINFVQSSEILGVSIHAGDLIQSVPEQELKALFQLQQVLFVWGDQLNTSAALVNLRHLEVAGLVYDRLDDLVEKRKRFSFFQAPEMQQIFLRQCIVAGNVSVSEGAPDTHSPFWPRVRTADEL